MNLQSLNPKFGKKNKSRQPIGRPSRRSFGSSRNSPPPSGTRDEPVNRSSWEAGPSGSPSGVSAVTKSAVLAICSTARRGKFLVWVQRLFSTLQNLSFVTWRKPKVFKKSKRKRVRKMIRADFWPMISSI